MKKQVQENNIDSKKRKRRNKTPRLALFSENERLYLKNKNDFDKVMRSKFYKDLDLRFKALIEDLELLQRSSKLNVWKEFRSYRYDRYFRQFNYFSNLFPHAKIFYVNALRQIRVKKEIYRYWIDNAPLNDARIDERSFNPDHFFRHCRNLLNDPNDEKITTRKILLDAFHNQGILPTKKKDAITFKEIKERLSGKSKERSNIEKNIDLKKLLHEDRESHIRIKGLEKLIQRKFKLLRDDAKRKYDANLQLQYGYVL